MPGRASLTVRPLPSLRTSLGAALTGVVALGTAGCGGTTPVAATPPSVSSSVSSSCAAMSRRLPDRVDGHARRTTTPSSLLLAAWGDPAVVLRCGAPAPPRPYAGNEFTAAGVTWLVQQDGDHISWFTIDRPVTVELSVPSTYDNQAAIATDLAPAITAAFPRVRPSASAG